jgi:hypothetical protein
MKQTLLAIMVFSLMLGFALTQVPEKPVLVKGDVVHFIKTFPDLEKDLEKFGFETSDDEMSIPEGFQANQELMGILRKHGWDENFFQKAAVILLGYASTRFGEESMESNSEIEQALKEIDSNPDLPASMKQQLKQQLMAARGAMGQTGQSLKQNIHPADLALVNAHIKELKPILDKDEE